MKNSHDLVITTYNSYKYLNNIYFFINDNLLSYSNIICIDDCSEVSFYYKLKKKLEVFKDLIIYRNKINLGPSGARNVGINISNSDYISFHDPDDYVFHKRAEYINKIICQHRPNIIFHDFTLSELPNKFNFSNNFKIHNGYLYLFKSLYVTPAFTCKREILNNIGGYDPLLRYAEDLDLYIRLRKKYNFYFVKEKLVKITNRLERHVDSSHLSHDFSLMRNSINKILIKNIFKFKPDSLIFLFAFLINILKALVEKIFI